MLMIPLKNYFLKSIQLQIQVQKHDDEYLLIQVTEIILMIQINYFTR